MHYYIYMVPRNTMANYFEDDTWIWAFVIRTACHLSYCTKQNDFRSNRQILEYKEERRETDHLLFQDAEPDKQI